MQTVEKLPRRYARARVRRQRQERPNPAPPRRCICVWQRTSPTRWALRLIHPRCPHHGGQPHWTVTP